MEDKIKNFLKELRLNESLISTAMGVVVVLIIGVLLYNFFSKKPSTSTPNDLQVESITGQPNEETDQPVVPDGLPTSHKVVKGEHLWGIAEKYYSSGYNWVDIAKENNLKNPNRIFVDQELTIPATQVKSVVSQTNQKSVSNSQNLPAISGDKYQVQSGDNLWTISVRAYADGFQWTKIYNENKTKIGQNPNLIFADVELNIPR